MSDKRLLLIDGNSFLYRAFFVMPPSMTAPDGLPTNAVFGFLRMLLRLLKDRKPTHAAVAFDVGKHTFRNDIYPDYKANRESMPEQLVPQVELCRELLRAMGVPILEAPGFEADDIIGAISGKAEAEKTPVAILSGDRDFIQLASDLVSVILTKKGVTEIDEWDAARVRAEYGIEPRQVVDKKGLEGDKSDNIPGVPGVGEKTALKLIKQFGGLEQVLAGTDKVSGKALKQKLEQYADQARMSRELSRIRRELPVEYDIEQFRLGALDAEKLTPALMRLGFRSIVAELGLEPDSGPEPGLTVAESAAVERIDSLRGFEEWAEKLARAPGFAVSVFAADYSYLDHGPEGVALAAPGLGPVAVVLESDGSPGVPVPAFLRVFRELAARARVSGHDLKRDWLFLKRLGVELGAPGFDTRIAAYLLEPEEKRQEIVDIWHRHRQTGLLALETPAVDAGQRAAKACESAAMVLELEPLLAERMAAAGLDRVFNEIEMPLVAILGRMQYNGVSVDENRLRALSEEFLSEEERIEAEIGALAGGEYNVRSPKQTAELLYEKMGLPRFKGDSTGHDVLVRLRPLNPVVDLIIRHREVSKLRGTFVDGLLKSIHPRTGRVHTSLEQTATATGRLSSRDPNLQNIPIRTESGKRIRRAFTAANHGLLLSADYSQIELRILAHFSGDERLAQAFARGEDIHAITAAEIFSVRADQVAPSMRRRAKAVNFGIIYGLTAFGLAEQLEVTRPEADAYLKRYFEVYGGIREYIDRTLESAGKEGFVETIFGRRRALPELKSRNRTSRQFAERTAVNTPVQGTAADIMKLAMIAVDKLPDRERLGVESVLQIHDELLFEVPRDSARQWADLARNAMENVVRLDVPLVVDAQAGENWLDMKPLNPNGP